MNTVRKTAFIATILMGATVYAGPCQNRNETIQAVKEFLKKEYGTKISLNSQIYPIEKTNRARVRSYPDHDTACVGEFCLEEESCSAKECTMEVMTTGGLQSRGFSCWSREDGSDEEY